MIKVSIGETTYELSGKLEDYFKNFRENIVGYNHIIDTPNGKTKIIYADWTASGRMYRPIELKLLNYVGPLIGNTHTESNITGTTMTLAYNKAKEIIKKHVNANKEDVLIMDGSGMTSVVSKLQRLLGLKVPSHLKEKLILKEEDYPVIFVTHMEHHSNYSWIETIGKVVCIRLNNKGMVDLDHLELELQKYKHHKMKIGAFTACSNVTGIQTPYFQLAKKMHEHGGICFIDFAASAPYVEINMHPEDPLEKLDGILFSPHKFLGGPGSCGVLILDSKLITSPVPDKPGGGTILWSNPWGEYEYYANKEIREDGGTPGFLQAIRTALAILLKEKMGLKRMLFREKEQVKLLLHELSKIPQVRILEKDKTDRLGIVSFYVEHIHYNLIVRLLNDRFGIQVRGGCSCAGPYGHYLLNIDKETSKQITNLIHEGDLSKKPGWVRISLHPVMTNEEIYTITRAIRCVIKNIKIWEKDYIYDSIKNEFYHIYHKNINIDHFFYI